MSESCRSIDRSTLGCLEVTPGKTNTAFTNVQDKWEALVDKDVRKNFADSVSSLFRELPQCTATDIEEWPLFKAGVASSAARVCGQKEVVVANYGKKVTTS